MTRGESRAVIVRSLGLILLFAARGWGQHSSEAAGAQAEMTMEAGGTHFRLVTDRGVVHVWEPSTYSYATAGVVVYVHGYFSSVDQAWGEGNLAAQFQASNCNALFIVPQAPVNVFQDVYWKSLPDLLEAVQQGIGIPIPEGPLIVIGHSGAFRTILDWLSEPRLRWVILLDALYQGQPQFRVWLRSDSGPNAHHLVLVANDTHRACARFARRFRGVVRRGRIPPNVSGFKPREKQAPLFYFRSQYNHMDIVSSGKVIPVMLQLTPLESPDEAKDLRKGTASGRKNQRAPQRVHHARRASPPAAD